MNHDILRSLPLFTGLPDSEIQGLAEVLPVDRFQAGEIIMQEGGVSDQLLILLDGEVEIIKSLGTSDERCMALRGPGTFLGEMSMFKLDGTHSASVRARTDLRTLGLSRGTFEDLIRRHPEVTYNLLKMLSRRLEDTENATILDLREKNRQLTLAYQELQAAQERLVEKERLERELEIASKLQMSILPQSLPVYPGLDLGALMVPAESVGGDFYDFIALGPDRLGVVVGDVCNKGIPAALFMTLSYTAMRSEALRYAEPGAALQAVNRRLIELNANDMFVTLLYGIIDLNTRRFSYARAGHPYPLLLDEQAKPVAIPTRTGQPVGLFEDWLLDEESVDLPAKATLVIYTDGLNEPLEEQGKAFDLAGLCSSLLGGSSHSAQEVCAGLWQTVKSHTGNAPAQDDFTSLVIRIS
jgi:sigma-B regulation protein RsbU (phosphoserine phosphatase)